MGEVMKNGPDLWRAILARFTEGRAIIAGGALRDYFLGVEPKDVDVFVPVQALPEVLELEGFAPLQNEEAEEYEGMDRVGFVFRGAVNGVQVDVVGLALADWSGRALVETFDFGITRSWFDGELGDTDEAKRDRETSTVTCLLEDRPQRAAKRFARFNERMGGAFTYSGLPFPWEEITVTEEAA